MGGASLLFWRAGLGLMPRSQETSPDWMWCWGELIPAHGPGQDRGSELSTPLPPPIPSPLCWGRARGARVCTEHFVGSRRNLPEVCPALGRLGFSLLEQAAVAPAGVGRGIAPVARHSPACIPTSGGSSSLAHPSRCGLSGYRGGRRIPGCYLPPTHPNTRACVRMRSPLRLHTHPFHGLMGSQRLFAPRIWHPSRACGDRYVTLGS